MVLHYRLDLEVTPLSMLTHRRPVYRAITHVVQSRDSAVIREAESGNQSKVKNNPSCYLASVNHDEGQQWTKANDFQISFRCSTQPPHTSQLLPSSLLKQKQDLPLFPFVTEMRTWEVRILCGGEAS